MTIKREKFFTEPLKSVYVKISKLVFSLLRPCKYKNCRKATKKVFYFSSDDLEKNEVNIFEISGGDFFVCFFKMFVKSQCERLNCIRSLLFLKWWQKIVSWFNKVLELYFWQFAKKRCWKRSKSATPTPLMGLWFKWCNSRQSSFYLLEKVCK